MFIDFQQYFSYSVPEATEKFVASFNSAHGYVEKFGHPLKDPNGIQLCTALGWLGPRDAERVLLIVSGTHGNEGWAGSAVQIDSMQRGLFKKLPQNTAVMMIHLVNPCGCAWGRRENEDNADLFRDLIYYKPDLYSDDTRFTDEIASALTLSDYTDKDLKQSDQLTSKLLSELGDLGFQEVMRAGQFRYPQAPCYNGGGISWSFRLYKELAVRYLKNAKQVFCIDIHTAFGEYGDGILIPYYQPEGQDKVKLDYLRNTYGAEKLHVGGFDPAIPSHPRMPYEIAVDFLPGLDMVATGLEFGTYSWFGLNLIKYMNYLFTRGDPRNPKRPDLVDQYNKLCYPDKDDWREMVITRSRVVIDQTLVGMEAWKK